MIIYKGARTDKSHQAVGQAVDKEAQIIRSQIKRDQYKVQYPARNHAM